MLDRRYVAWAPVLGTVALFACSSEDPSEEPSTWTWGGGGSAGAAGVAGSGGGGEAGATTGGASGFGGTAGSAAVGGNAGQQAHVAILSPADGATVENPVAFELEAHGVDTVELLADGTYPLPVSWDPKQTPTHSMAYSFSGLGWREITLRGLVAGMPAAAHVIQIEVALPPLCDGFDTNPLVPPTACDGPNGSTTTQIPSNRLYATSWFGCYRETDGSIYEDPYDNCEFACGPMGYCPSGQGGPECEADLMWFAADADRYGCGGLIRATNCQNGRAVVLVTLDRGPNCGSVEGPCEAPVLDMSHPAMDYLFEGSFYGGCDHQRVVVEPVPDGTPLGPVE